ncbi:MAG: nucleotidyltransferase domain-containing protein [Candidatus Aenigmatarchaeota archaeon]
MRLTNEMTIVLKIFKTPEREFNANSISKEIGITPMGALKILKRLEKDGILTSKAAGRATFYTFNFSSVYAKDYVKFALRSETEHAQPYVKRWVNEIRKLKNADMAILFGSVLRKGNDANDVDVLALTNQNKLEKLKEEIAELNKIGEKHIHAIYQSPKDLRSNIKKQDKVVLNTLKGIAAFGEDKLIEAFS